MDILNRQGKQGSEPVSDIDGIRESTILQSVINAIPAPIFYKDAKGLYIGCNRAFENFVGRSKDEMVGKGVFELWDKDMKECRKKIAPEFNRLVVFSTNETSFHGHPTPFNEHKQRLAFTTYYYTTMRPSEEHAPFHWATWQKRPV